MFNPFKKSFLIQKLENLSGESYYTVEYGWLWNSDYLGRDGGLWTTHFECCEFCSLDDAKDAVRKFSARKLEERLSKRTITQSFKI